MEPGFRMSIGAAREGVGEVLRGFADFATVHALSDEVRRSVNVALDELLANTVSYGLDATSGTATVAAAIADGRLVLTLTDNGREFDPFARAAPDTTLSVEHRQIGGLGIHLVKELMDEVSYRRDGDLNVVVLVKRLGARPGPGTVSEAG